MQKNEHDLRGRLRKLLAIEFNCSPDDFTRQENVLTAWVEVGAGKIEKTQEKEL